MSAVELPPALRAAVEGLLDGVSTDRLARAASVLSERYRAELRDGRLHVSDDEAAAAYLAARLPATFAASRRALAAAEAALPHFAPLSQLDFGSGPGTALFAASDTWTTLRSAHLVEASAAMRAACAKLAEAAGAPAHDWSATDLGGTLPAFAPHDLVTIAYVLDELDEAARQRLIAAAWRATSGALVIVEPGTPAGWRRILAARDGLITEGARIAAPCPHAAPCPVAAPDWCHFAVRLPRSRLHRRTKQADSPFEDEKFAYLVASRTEAEPIAARVLTPPRAASGRIGLKLCRSSGDLEEVLVTRREGEAFRIARRLEWGDAAPSAIGR